MTTHAAQLITSQHDKRRPKIEEAADMLRKQITNNAEAGQAATTINMQHEMDAVFVARKLRSDGYFVTHQGTNLIITLFDE
jgi:isocitrate lyase